MLYGIRPRRDLDSKLRNAIYRAINNGALPPEHAQYPAVKVEDDVLEIILHEVHWTCHDILSKRRMYGTTKTK